MLVVRMVEGGVTPCLIPTLHQELHLVLVQRWDMVALLPLS